MVEILTKDTNCKWDWIDVTSPQEADFQHLAENYQLHPSLVQDSLQPDHLPKFEVVNHTSFVIVRVFDKEVGEEGDTVQDLTNKIAIFYNEAFIITVHLKPYPFLHRIKSDLVAQDHCANPHHLFIYIIQQVLFSFEAPALRLASELDFYESKVFLRKHTPYNLTTGMYWLKRKAEVTKRVLNLSKIVLDNLDREQHHDPLVQDTKDLYLRLLNMYEEIDNSTNNLLNIYIGLASQRTNETIRVLTIFSVFFMPLTFIVGIYGMNFKFMPELRQPWGYPAVMLLMLLITSAIYWWFKKRGWL